MDVAAWYRTAGKYDPLRIWKRKRERNSNDDYGVIRVREALLRVVTG